MVLGCVDWFDICDMFSLLHSKDKILLIVIKKHVGYNGNLRTFKNYLNAILFKKIGTS